jgi:anaerobic ribonucleoside-triphosphate reductase activating protein
MTRGTQAKPLTLSVSRVVEHCSVLGPGMRFVVWVQGCPLRCRGCIAEELLAFEGGNSLKIDELAERIVADSQLEGVTFSGGEPFAQARAVAAVIRAARAERPGLSTMSYSGYPLAWLRTHGTRAQRDLLGLLDIVIDGPYIERLHRPLRWRGSTNQRINFLTARHSDFADLPDESVGMEFSLDASRSLSWAGVPPVPDFRTKLTASLSASGLNIQELD